MTWSRQRVNGFMFAMQIAFHPDFGTVAAAPVHHSTVGFQRIARRNAQTSHKVADRGVSRLAHAAGNLSTAKRGPASFALTKPPAPLLS